MEVSKIRLSEAEAELMKNAEVILTKNSVLGKIDELLAVVADKQLRFINSLDVHQEGNFRNGPKISRGENYEGLPYRILDFPRYSENGNLFFLRTMFWWGNYFSTTLHVAGNETGATVSNLVSVGAGSNDLFIGINEDQWQHHFRADNYALAGTFTNEQIRKMTDRSGFLKIASRLSLNDWEMADVILFERWKSLLTLSGLITDAME